MPTPGPDESRDDFLERCIPIVLDDGTAEDNDQAVAICSSLWEREQEGKTMIHKTIDFEIQEKAENGGRIVISTGDLDRDRDRVKPHGANVTNYLRNPVVQFAHNYYDPWATIGRTVNLEVKPEGLVADFELRPAANDEDPQNIVRLLWDGGWIRTASIGFNPTKAVDNDEGGRDFEEWDLLEWSLVPVPANQAALRLTAKAFTDKPPDSDNEPNDDQPVKPSTDHIEPEALDADIIESLRNYINELNKTKKR